MVGIAPVVWIQFVPLCISSPHLLCVQPKQKKGAEPTLMANAGSRNRANRRAPLRFHHRPLTMVCVTPFSRLPLDRERGLGIGSCPSLVTVSDVSAWQASISAASNFHPECIPPRRT